MPRRLLTMILIVLSLIPWLVAAGEFQVDLKARRARAMERLGSESMLILWSAPSRTYSLDVDYEYHQDNNLIII